ncbi:hypothetical protein PC116_g22389 [Phytophthora cactorum]|uniref:Uncharacterized protein n=1 Tax=Phytophthora cactorum TaxID=29920 RepID=A0A8T1B3R4_9STRA|nr:hypothetical protein PC112_g19238 [Phytophthora cactorum]KAG3092489.1 hypothetical protein PI125_g17130 [Phytophthora idaei]KAG2804176.1 hypothetical protein PC111_g18374 [Phytophthora cactorum]KAG2840958.1 hypothetical protein PC113_g19135 [Phytophthora cactorum]KAG2882672.1 hypothetical protein PC114_g20902 [Phytophthora cactorum]
MKKAITEDQKYDFASTKLQLFLAKSEGGEWLPSTGPGVITTRSQDVPTK